MDAVAVVSDVNTVTLTRVHYGVEPKLDVTEFRRVLVESGLGTIRPVDDTARLQAMLDAADLVVGARLGAYLSDLAVVASAQRLHIGQGLLDEARRRLGPRVALILSSVPDAVGFYERAGLQRIADAFWYPRSE